MRRFKISALSPTYFQISGEEFYHLTKVLRLQEGEQVIGFDNSGRQWLGIISELSRDTAYCQIIKEETPSVEAGTSVYLVMGLAKGEKMEWVIQKGTELGMKGFVPLRAQRSVLQLEGKKAEDRVRRWQRIATEAVKQSRRTIEPRVERIVGWSELKGLFPTQTQWLLAYEEEKTKPFKKALPNLNYKDPIAILIGPEGGFAPEEVTLARQMLGAESVSLGPRILRAETAALASLTMVLFYHGDLG
ncbi:MAG: RsmE family RNA methyltransferase [Desulfitobacteriia bacterium]|jgi:16S rRNA (uracil1498-N3)-methyltransferase